MIVSAYMCFVNRRCICVRICNIEGAEYEVLRKMIVDKSITYVDDLSVEFHSHKDSGVITENGENKETTFTLIKEIQDLGVKFTHWI